MGMKGDEQNMAVTSRFTNLRPPFWSFSAVFRMKHGGRDRPEWESKRSKPYSLELGGMGGGGCLYKTAAKYPHSHRHRPTNEFNVGFLYIVTPRFVFKSWLLRGSLGLSIQNNKLVSAGTGPDEVLRTQLTFSKRFAKKLAIWHRNLLTQELRNLSLASKPTRKQNKK